MNQANIVQKIFTYFLKLVLNNIFDISFRNYVCKIRKNIVLMMKMNNRSMGVFLILCIFNIWINLVNALSGPNVCTAEHK